jgi:dipeptidyl aminopeptidase/acylaminoacyl peptidase
MLARILALASLLLSTVAATAPAVGPLVAEDDYRRIVALNDAAIAPDGKAAVIVVSRVVWDEDRRQNDLVSVDLATRTRQTLMQNRKGLSDPAFSPDGAQLAFLADEGNGSDASTQVFVMPANGGDAKPVTHTKAGVNQFAWRPDGRALVYAAEDPEPVRSGADRFRNSFIFTTEPIVAHSPSLPIHLFLLNLNDDATTQLTFGASSVANDSTLSWSPDGATIAFTLCRDAILNDQSYSHVALVDLASKKVRSLTGRTMWEADPRFSPDGAHLAYAYSDGDPQVNLTRLYITTVAGGIGRPLSGAIDRPIGDAVWSPDSKSLIATAPDRTTNALYRLSLDGAAQRIPLGDLTPGVPLTTTGGANAPSLGNAIASDGTLVFLATAATQPVELYGHSASGATAQLTDFNAGMAQFAWASAQRITFPTTAGDAGDGVLYRPPGFSPARKYPLVAYIHGGPSDASMLAFDFWAQVMAARGWLVLRPNYRGSPNLGLRYQRAILYDPEEGPGKDIISALDVVRSWGIVDDSRIAVSGWSYGGIMTAWMISRYHFWRAAVSGASVNDWTADYGTADDSLADVDLFHGSPFVAGNAAEWRRNSAISYVRDVTTPVLILSDVGDNRDPFATSSMYWRALRDNGKTATLRVWPIQGHFPSDPVRTVDVYHYWIDFIAQYFR